MTQFRFAALGLDHRHIFGMSQGMIDAGCELAGYWTKGNPEPLSGFEKRFPDAARITELDRILNDSTIPLVLIASAPADRAELAIKAMRHGKDVMVDKPGCITLDELAEIKAAAVETGRIWSINFSERFEVKAVSTASQMVAEGRIGRVLQTIGMGPHRLNAPMRPDWFFDHKVYGGILTDIASHQIDQFLHFTHALNPDSTDSGATIAYASAENRANPDLPNFQDFGEINIRSANASGYIRVDWFTPEALPNWGDGRLFLLGTEGYIELRKYVDIAGRSGTNHLFLANGSRVEYVDCNDAELPYFSDLTRDILERTERACPATHTFRVMKLALQAQAQAE